MLTKTNTMSDEIPLYTVSNQQRSQLCPTLVVNNGLHQSLDERMLSD